MAPGFTGSSEAGNLQFMAISGMPNVEQTLKDISKWKPEHSIFFEMSACAGSCVNGPKAARDSSITAAAMTSFSTPGLPAHYRASSRSI